MAKFEANPLTVRFLDVYNVLKEVHNKAGKDLTKAEFSRKCGTYPNIMNDVLALRRNVSLKYVEALFDSYPMVRREYLKSGEQPVLSDGTLSDNDTDLKNAGGVDMNQIIVHLEDKISMLKSWLSEKDKRIQDKDHDIKVESRSGSGFLHYWRKLQ
jgi:hypothetical protein